MGQLRLVVLCLFLSSCAFIDPISIGTFVADGIVQSQTGKGIVDSAVSKVAGQDCKLFRIVNGEKACKDDQSVDRELLEKMLEMECDSWRFEDDKPVCL